MLRAEGFTRWQGVVCLLTLLLPFGEGGATPAALFLVHTFILILALSLAISGDPSPRPALLPEGLSTAIPLFLAAILLATWNSPYPYASFLRCWEIGIVVAIFILARRIGWNSRSQSILVDCVLAAGVVQALVIVAGSRWVGLSAAVARWGLLNVNHEAAYLSLGALVSGASLFRGEGGRSWLRGAGVLLCLAAFTMLASRGALLGLGAAFLTLAVVEWREMPARARRAVATIFILALVFTLAGIARRFSSAGDPFPYERTRIWSADLRAWEGSPLLGVGPGIFRHVSPRFNFPREAAVRFGQKFETPHSDYLGLLVETGLIGFGACVFLLARILSLVARSARESRRFGAGLLAAVVAFAVQGLVEDLSIRPALLLTLAILTAAISRPCGEPEFREEAPLNLSRRWLFLAAPLSIAWMVGVLNPYLSHRSALAMRHAGTLEEMLSHFGAAVRRNPYQSATWGFPASAFLAARPPVNLTLDLYGRFRRELDRGIQADSTSADLFVTRARLEVRAFRSLFHDEPTVERALDAYRQGIGRVPHDPRVRIEMAEFLRELGKTQEALDQVDRSLIEEPGFLSARLLRASLLLEWGNRQGAEEEWRKAEALRKQLVNYRPDSPYSSDITRDYPRLQQQLQGALEGP